MKREYLSESDVVGRVYGQLTILAKAPSRKGNMYVLCRCSCGVEKEIKMEYLKSGATKSCGCMSLARLKSGELTRKHGGHKRPEYSVWLNMRRRCYDPKNHKFPLYGARGIKICQRWLDNFQNFLDDMGERPSPEHSIDRKDNDGDYTPDNCHWALPLVQANNTRRKITFEMNGESHTLREWCDLYGRTYNTVLARLRLGWTFEQAITERIAPRSNNRPIK